MKPGEQVNSRHRGAFRVRRRCSPRAYNPATAGVTTLELLVACSIFVIVIVVAYAIMLRSHDTFNLGATTSEVQERARLCMDTLTRELLETSIASVDTAQRTFQRGVGGTFSDNFEYVAAAFPAPIACLNESCAWVFNALTHQPRLPNAYLGQNYTERLFPHQTIVSVIGGSKVWPNTDNTNCPFCNAPFFIENPAHLDGVKFFTPRTVQGKFITEEGFDNAVDFQGILFYFPFYNTETRTLELRRYAFYISDLFSTDPVTGEVNPLYADRQAIARGNAIQPPANPPPMPAWMNPKTHNPPGKPTLFDLLDTNADGRIDIKHNVVNAECTWEQFCCVDGRQLVFSKNASDATGFTSFWLQIELATGRISCLFSCRRAGASWWRWCQFTRMESYPDFPAYRSEPAYTVLGTNLADIQISTHGSNPHISGVNPWGIREQNPAANPNGRLVRITIAFERPVMVGGVEYQPTTVLQTEVWPRN